MARMVFTYGGGNVVGVGALVIGCADDDVGPPLANVLRHCDTHLTRITESLIGVVGNAVARQLSTVRRSSCATISRDRPS